MYIIKIFIVANLREVKGVVVLCVNHRVADVGDCKVVFVRALGGVHKRIEQTYKNRPEHAEDDFVVDCLVEVDALDACLDVLKGVGLGRRRLIDLVCVEVAELDAVDRTLHHSHHVCLHLAFTLF